MSLLEGLNLRPAWAYNGHSNGHTRGMMMSVRTWVRFHTQRRFKMHRLTILNRTVCRWRGHRWERLATEWLGCCDRCFRDWPDGVRGELR